MFKLYLFGIFSVKDVDKFLMLQYEKYDGSEKHDFFHKITVIYFNLYNIRYI